MKLIKFRIQNFRSITDSGWIDVNNLTCFVGLNEVGKSNILLALSKLNPSEGAESIEDSLDYPATNEYSNDDDELKKKIFATALFKANTEDINGINTIIELHNYNVPLVRRVEKIKNEYFSFARNYKDEVVIRLSNSEGMEGKHFFNGRNQKMFRAVCQILPKFLHYSEYECLDSYINLPKATSRIKEYDDSVNENYFQESSLKNLLKYFNLETPDKFNEWFTLKNEGQQSKQKKLMTSKSESLSKKFNEWWPDSNCNFAFRLNGDVLEISVKDEQRKNEIDLEQRSAGLKWAFSFFLTFLADKRNNSEDYILLLDDPGLTLHPIAQRALMELFQTISKKTQLLYTTHLPFLIDGNNLDNVYKVYADKNDKSTKVTSDLQLDDEENRIQPVYAAIGIRAAESLFIDSDIVVVEGESDQFYLSMIQNYLKTTDFKINRNLAFIPAGGAKNIKNIVSVILGFKEDEKPYVLVDSDSAGKDAKKSLRGKFYKTEQNKVLEIGTFIKEIGKKDGEIEDLIPEEWIIEAFKEHFEINEKHPPITCDGSPIIPILEKFASDNLNRNLKDESERAWKTEVAKIVKGNFKNTKVDEKYENMWQALFNAFQGKPPA